MMIEKQDYHKLDFIKEIAAHPAKDGYVILSCVINPSMKQMFFSIKKKGEIFEFVNFEDAVGKFNEMCGE